MKSLKMLIEVQQNLMRHADIRTTMNTYGERPMQDRVKPTAKLSIVFDRKSSSGDWNSKAEAGAVGARAS